MARQQAAYEQAVSEIRAIHQMMEESTRSYVNAVGFLYSVHAGEFALPLSIKEGTESALEGRYGQSALIFGTLLPLGGLWHGLRGLRLAIATGERRLALAAALRTEAAAIQSTERVLARGTPSSLSDLEGCVRVRSAKPTVANSSVHSANYIELPRAPESQGVFKLIHGNSIASPRTAYLYRLETEGGEFLKWGVTQDMARRYPTSFMKGKVMKEFLSGSRAYLIRMERGLVETQPGPLNFERWAGSRLGGQP